MLKNLLQQVIKKDKFTNEYIAFPTFHDLAPRAFKKIDAEDIWKLDLNDLFHHVSKFESYLDSIRDNYTQLLQRIMSHQSTLDEERKRMQQIIQERTGTISDLEFTIRELKELREQRTQTQKITKILKTDIDSSHKQFNSIHTQVDSHKDTQAREEQLAQQINQLKQQCREHESSINTLLSQIVEVQSKQRVERSSSFKQNDQQNIEIKNLKSQLESEREKSLSSIQNTLGLESDLELKQNEIYRLSTEMNEMNQNALNSATLIASLRSKREAAITEIQTLSSRLLKNEKPFPSYSLSLDNIREIKVGLQQCLIKQRKRFELLYKKFLSEACLIQEKFGLKETKDLFVLEKDINCMIIDLQDLLDEVDDVIFFP